MTKEEKDYYVSLRKKYYPEEYTHRKRLVRKKKFNRNKKGSSF